MFVASGEFPVGSRRRERQPSMLSSRLCHLVRCGAAALSVHGSMQGCSPSGCSPPRGSKCRLSYLSSAVCSYINDSYPEFSGSPPFPFQGLVSFPEELLRLLVHSHPHFTPQSVLGCLQPAVSVDACLPVAHEVSRLRSG